MSFAEIMLRMGVTVAGWLIFIAHMLTVAVIRESNCNPGSDEMWQGTLLFGSLSGIAITCAGMGLQWKDSIRWLAAVGFLLAVLAARVVVPAIGTVTLGGDPLCSIAVTSPHEIALGSGQATQIQRIWPAVQLGVLLIGIVQAIRYWRPGVPPPSAHSE